MNKETMVGIAKWLLNKNLEQSTKIVLVSFLLDEIPSNYDIFKPIVPKTKLEFKNLIDLIKKSPETYQGIKILAKKDYSWSNIDKFWDELNIIFNKNLYISSNLNLDNAFNIFLDSIINIKYANKNHQKVYDLRYNNGLLISLFMNFDIKKLPKKIISY